jgi:hypothetical protein
MRRLDIGCLLLRSGQRVLLGVTHAHRVRVDCLKGVKLCQLAVQVGLHAARHAA